MDTKASITPRQRQGPNHLVWPQVRVFSLLFLSLSTGHCGFACLLSTDGISNVRVCVALPTTGEVPAAEEDG